MLIKKANFLIMFKANWSRWTECSSECIQKKRRICMNDENCEGGFQIEQKKCTTKDNRPCFSGLEDHINGNLSVI